MTELLDGWEDWIAFFEARLPQPLDRVELRDGSILYTSGQPAEVVVHLTRRVITVSEFAVSWESPDRAVAAPRRLGTIRWRRLNSSRAISIVEQLLAGARDARRSRFVLCPACDRVQPPESMLDDGVCLECADSRPSVVH